MRESKTRDGQTLFRTIGRDGMLLMLTWAAGSIDAISYLELDHVFPAMMTGNTVLLGLALAQGHVLAAFRSILALIGFAAGVALGAFVVKNDQNRADWPPAVTGALVLEGIILGIFTLTWHLAGTERSASSVHVLILLSALAMGIQAAAVRHLGVPGIATTYITGTLTSLMVDLVGWIRSEGSAQQNIRDDPPVPIGLLASVFFAYGLGALAGGVLQARSSTLATLAPLAAVAVVVANAALRYQHRRTLL